MKSFIFQLDEEKRRLKEKRINYFLRSFFSARYETDKLILDNLEYFFFLICTFHDDTNDFIENYPYPEFDWNKVTTLGFLDKLDLINNYFKDKKIPFNMDSIIHNGILDVTFTDSIKVIKEEAACLEQGYDCLTNDKKNESLEVYDNNLVTDTITWVHELSHHFNISDFNLNIIRALFTESLAFAEEFVYLDYLEEQEFNYEGFNYKFREFRNLYRANNYCYMVIKPYLIFQRYGYFSKENYVDFFEYEDDYDKCLDTMINIIDHPKMHDLIYKLIKYSIAFGLSSYMYIEYTKDKTFYQKMEEFNIAIQEKGAMEALKVIGINGLEDEEVDKVKENMLMMMEELIYGSDHTIGKEALTEDYINELAIIFNDKTYLFNNIHRVLHLIEFLRESIGKYLDNKTVDGDIHRLSKASKEKKEEIIRLYYCYTGRKPSITQFEDITEIKKPVIEDDEDKETMLIRASLSGTSYYDDETKEKHAIVNDTGLLLDSVTWVHEFKHLDNQPNKIRNEVSFLLTESISFTEELIYGDFLKELGFNYESAFCKYDFLSNLSVYFEDAYPIIKLFILYLETGKINKLDYFQMYGDDNIEDLLSETLPLLTDDPEEVLRSIRYSVGCALSLYMYNEYKKDNSFMEKINKLNNSINEKSLEECLRIIGINDLDLDNFGKFRIAIEAYKKELNEIIKSGILKPYDIEKVIVKK